MAAEKKYDFMGIKCQQDMSDHFVLQCLGVALLNNHYDADGEKQPIPTSCECDCDGALTMRILSLCAEGAPSCLLDIKFFDEASKEFVLANCGSVAPYFANPDDREDALKKTVLMPHIFGEAGGASLQMIAKPGAVTVARLFRSNGNYVLGCFEGTTKMYPVEKLKETTYCYPHAFVEADVDYQAFYQKINSNHLHMVYGNYAKVLEMFCDMTGIEYLCFNKMCIRDRLKLELDRCRVIPVSPLLNDHDINKIKMAVTAAPVRTVPSSGGKYANLLKLMNGRTSILRCDCRSKDEAIRLLGGRLQREGYVDEGFVDSVFVRENLAATSIGCTFAIPHAYEGHVLRQGIGLMTLKHPVLWGGEEKVQIILMLSIDAKLNESFKVIFSELANLTKDMLAVDRILKADRFSDILKVFK